MDHAAGFVDAQFQTSLNSHQTLDSVKAFEALACQHGVPIQNCLTDNGTSFRDADFEAKLSDHHQCLKHSSAGRICKDIQ